MSTSRPSTTPPKKGFSLTEMAVVIASVAAIVVMTTTGINIVSQTHLNRITQDINAFTSAMESFEQIYDALPGDISDVSALPSSESGTGGNGDGTINTAGEALNFWRHLSRTGLLSGDYDGSSTNIPGTGVPAGSSTASGFNVFNPTSDSSDTLYDQAIIFEFAGFSSSSNQLAVLRPVDARHIDHNGDDGNPSTGLIRGAGTGCIDDNSTSTNYSDDKYDVSQDDIKCRLLFIIRQPAATTVASDVSGECVEIGTYRESTSEICPSGTEGSVIEMCSSTGNWVVVERDCESITCSGGHVVGATRTLNCLDGQTGIVLQECNSSGAWVDIENSCTVADETGTSCTTGDTRLYPCEWGKTGYRQQVCTGGDTWENNTSDSTCVSIRCGTSALGTVRTSGTSKDCDDNSAQYSTSGSSAVHEMCSLDGQWHVIHNTCLPIYGSCTSGSDTTRNIKCPPGEQGQHEQTCIDNGSSGDYWVTTKDTCQPVRCGSHTLGYQRSSSVQCPGGAAGTVMQICGTTWDSGAGQWKGMWYSTNNTCALRDD